MRTLKILLHVYMYELRRSQLMEEAKLERLFLSVEELLGLHLHFLRCLKARQKEAQTEESPNGYQINQFGDILVSQVGKQEVADSHGSRLAPLCELMLGFGDFVFFFSFQVLLGKEWWSVTVCSAAITTSP